MNTNNPMKLVQQLRQIQNPQQIAMNMLKQNSANNPIIQNIYQMAQNNDVKGIENVARNMFKEQGKDFDSEFNQFKQMFGMK